MVRITRQFADKVLTVELLEADRAGHRMSALRWLWVGGSSGIADSAVGTVVVLQTVFVS